MNTCCFCEGHLNGNSELERKDKFGNIFCCTECAMDYYNLTPLFGVDFDSALNTLLGEFELQPLQGLNVYGHKAG